MRYAMRCDEIDRCENAHKFCHLENYASRLNMQTRIFLAAMLSVSLLTHTHTYSANHKTRDKLWSSNRSRWNWCFVIIIALSTTLNLTHWFHFATLTQSTKNIPAVECHSPHFVRNWVEHWLFSELMMPSHQRWNVLVQEFTHYLAI